MRQDILIKKLILARIYFDKLYIIGPTGDQYEGVERINHKADVEFVKDIKDLTSPDQLPKDLKKLMIFDYVRAKEPVINEYFCRGRHNNCNMIYLNQNLFTIDRQSVRENCNLFILFEQRGKVHISIYQDFFDNVELSYNDFANICNKVWKEPYNYIVIGTIKIENINGKLRINWDRRVLYFSLSLYQYLELDLSFRLDQRSCRLHQMGLRPADYVRCKLKPNTTPLKSIGLPCSSLI